MYVLYAVSVLVVRPYIRFAFTVIDVIINLLLAAVAGLSIVNTSAAPSAAPTTGGGGGDGGDGGDGGGRLLLRGERGLIANVVVQGAGTENMENRSTCAGRDISMTILGGLVVCAVFGRTVYSATVRVWRFRRARRAKARKRALGREGLNVTMDDNVDDEFAARCARDSMRKGGNEGGNEGSTAGKNVKTNKKTKKTTAKKKREAEAKARIKEKEKQPPVIEMSDWTPRSSSPQVSVDASDSALLGGGGAGDEGGVGDVGGEAESAGAAGGHVPAESQAAAQAAPQAESRAHLLGAGWAEAVDEGGTTYYYHEDSGETRWDVPPPGDAHMETADEGEIAGAGGAQQDEAEEEEGGQEQDEASEEGDRAMPVHANRPISVRQIVKRSEKTF